MKTLNIKDIRCHSDLIYTDYLITIPASSRDFNIGLKVLNFPKLVYFERNLKIKI